MSKTKRYAEFQEFENCYTLHHDDSSIDLELDSSKDLILELGCGSGVYTLELAKRFPDNQFIGIDSGISHLAGSLNIKSNIILTSTIKLHQIELIESYNIFYPNTTCYTLDDIKNFNLIKMF